ncbi:NAD(P)H-quinone oxidoreductase [Paenibacillus sp. UNC499MF]|uniref:NAD(P)H-quinone oxidoreductase n=1 Tax=Paenibacillus sp. UNC499MF TaxID=1502751 RepID=UPI00089FD70A|nr:NAD(P)H-quinone oxidoreductase [Paenibacillus sp. UNC499MF]SEG16498.1 putative NAD(P)H quinone oxidoreductase, PIG3 family [Paenibacillus sp. UNC499MF]
MKAVQIKQYGGPEELYIGERPDPVAGEGELLIQVKAAGLNRADLMQREGKYPAVPGESDILGLEMAGVVIGVGSGVTGWREGERVCALLPGGGYAERVTVPAGMAMRLPANLSYAEGAAIPEAFLTAYLNLVKLGGMTEGDYVLIHAGASGVGSAAIQLAREFGAHVLVTAGSSEKLEFCRELGAEYGWNYREGSFLPWLREATGGHGSDIVLDLVGAPYFTDHLAGAAVGGRIVLVGMTGGSEVPMESFDLNPLLMKRISIIGSTLRSRSREDKIRLTQQFWQQAGHGFADGALQPVVDRIFPWSRVREAHQWMEANRNKGKVILDITADAE